MRERSPWLWFRIPRSDAASAFPRVNDRHAGGEERGRIACSDGESVHRVIAATLSHSRIAGSMGPLSRAVSIVIPPKRFPKAASSVPILIRFLGETASSRIARISASTLRPLRAARSLSARWVSSGSLRMVTFGVRVYFLVVRFQLQHSSEWRPSGAKARAVLLAFCGG